MDLDAFKASLADDAAPDDVSRALQALWHQAKGDWEKAHALAQAEDDSNGAWVHAHLHRVEGDEGNAGYWYRRAGRTLPAPDSGRIQAEIRAISSVLAERQ